MIKTVWAALAATLLTMAAPAAASASGDMRQASLGSSAVTIGQDRTSAAMRIFDETRPPVGYVDFCRRHPQDCRGGAAAPRRAELTAERWVELNQINTRINVEITPMTDMELYGTPEYWTYPDAGAGDCEDYVLLKRRELMARGWPAESLLITVVMDEDGEGHAVLTAVTDHGEFVLDNKHNTILAWHETPYEFRKRQSMAHPHIWVSLTPGKHWHDDIMPASPR